MENNNNRSNAAGKANNANDKDDEEAIEDLTMANLENEGDADRFDEFALGVKKNSLLAVVYPERVPILKVHLRGEFTMVSVYSFVSFSLSRPLYFFVSVPTRFR